MAYLRLIHWEAFELAMAHLGIFVLIYLYRYVQTTALALPIPSLSSTSLLSIKIFLEAKNSNAQKHEIHKAKNSIATSQAKNPSAHHLRPKTVNTVTLQLLQCALLWQLGRERLY